jgi:hypothetical protein
MFVGFWPGKVIYRDCDQQNGYHDDQWPADLPRFDARYKMMGGTSSSATELGFASSTAARLTMAVVPFVEVEKSQELGIAPSSAFLES